MAGLTLVGYWIDGKFATSPWGVLGGLAMGLTGGIYNLVKASLAAVREANNQDTHARDDQK